MKYSLYLLICLFLCASLGACKDEVDESDIYTFTAMTARDYIDSNPDLSLFSRILRRSRNSQKENATSVDVVINTYHNFTIFAPTNEALKIYLDSLYGSPYYNVDTMSAKNANDIVLNCIIDTKKEAALHTMKLPEGYIQEETMNGSYLKSRFGDFGDGCIVRVNDRSRIIKEDIKVTNGYIHLVDRVITAGPGSLSGLISETPNLRIFSMLLDVTSWKDSLLKVEDKAYEDSIYPLLMLNGNNNYKNSYIKKRLYGYMAFVETDEVFEKEWGVPSPEIDSITGGIKNREKILSIIASRCKDAYPQATETDATLQDNAINQFVSYHLVPYKEKYFYLVPRNRGEIGSRKGETHLLHTIDGHNYFQTMGTPTRMFKMTEEAITDIKRINRHSYYNHAYFADGEETSCDYEGITVERKNGIYENEAPNGFYYPINHILLYDDYVRNTVLNERIRYDFIQMMPELTNYDVRTLRKWVFEYKDLPEYGITAQEMKNDKRGKSSFTQLLFPEGFFENIDTNGETWFDNLSMLYEGNKVVFQSDRITFKLLPIPFAGNWEIRLACIKGQVTCYLGENTTNILKMKRIGDKDFDVLETFTPPYELEGLKGNPYPDYLFLKYNQQEDSALYIENDKICRLHNMMKLPFSYGVYEQYGQQIFEETYFDEKHYRSLRNIENLYISPNFSLGRTSLYRHIVYRGYMRPGQTYYLTLINKSMTKPYNGREWIEQGSWFIGDLIELVPESVYDNPNKKEDYW